MSNDKEGQSETFQRIGGMTSLEEILRTAAAFEQSAFELYSALVPKVGKSLRHLLVELAAEEQSHMALFSDLEAHPDLESHLKDTIASPEEDHRFSDYILTTDLGESPDDQAVLQYALGREDAAMKQYRELAQATEPGPAHDLFVFLADEETRHKRELEKLYYERIHGNLSD